MNDLRAELAIFMDPNQRLFDFNVSYVRDGGEVNASWESAGIFDTVHDALEQGRTWLFEAKQDGYKRGNKCVPRVWQRKAA